MIKFGVDCYAHEGKLDPIDNECKIPNLDAILRLCKYGDLQHCVDVPINFVNGEFRIGVAKDQTVSLGTWKSENERRNIKMNAHTVNLDSGSLATLYTKKQS